MISSHIRQWSRSPRSRPVEAGQEAARAEQVNDTVGRSWTRSAATATNRPCASKMSRSTALSDYLSEHRTEYNEPRARLLLRTQVHPKIPLSCPFSLVIGRTISALWSRERRLESCYAPRYTARHLSGIRFRERNGSGQPRACAVRCGQLDRTQCSDQRMHPRSGPLSQAFARFGTKRRMHCRT